MPNVILQPGESIIIYNKTYKHKKIKNICNTNFEYNKTICLYNTVSEIIEDKICIPRMSVYETYGREESGVDCVFYNNIDGTRCESTY